MSDFKIAYADDGEYPVCPHCGQDMPTIRSHEQGMLQVQVAYWCPHCRRLLAVNASIAG